MLVLIIDLIGLTLSYQSKNKMAELEKSLSSSGFDSSRSIVLTDIADLTSAATSSPQQDGSSQVKKGKKAKNEPKTFKKQDLIKSLLERLTKGSK